MKNILRKALLITLLALVPFLSFAGGHSAPLPRHHFFLSIIGGIFKQSVVGTGFAVNDSNSNINGVPASPIVRVKTQYYWSPGVTFGYLLNNHNDIRFYFLRHADNNTTTVTPRPGGHVDTAILPPQYLITAASGASSRYKYDTNIYQMSFGHWLNLGKAVFSFHPFFGVGGANFCLRQDTTYSSILNPPALGRNANVQQRSSLWGLGPLAGFDSIWHFNRHFSLESNITWNLLIASIEHSYKAQLPGFQSANLSGSLPGEIINFVSVKVDIAYQFLLNKHKAKLLVGYYANDFINAKVKTMLMDNITPVYTAATKDTGFQGPFVQFYVEI